MYRDTRTTITNDGLEMIFSSNRPGSLGGIELWVSTRNGPADEWSPPTNLGLPVNSTGARTRRSNEGLRLFFASNRPGGSGSDDIHVSVRLSAPDGSLQKHERKEKIDDSSTI